MVQQDEVPTCWKCRRNPGVVCDGTAHWCVACAGDGIRDLRQQLQSIDDAVRAGLPAWPRIPDRVEFVRECVKLHREDARRGLATETIPINHFRSGL